MERTPTDFGTTDEASSATSGGDFVSRLERILRKPAVQQRLLAEAPEEVQQAVMSEFSDTPTETPDAPTDADTTDTTDATDAEATGDVTPEKLVEFLNQIEEQVGGQYTVTQLRTFTEANPAMVENLLDEYL